MVEFRRYFLLFERNMAWVELGSHARYDDLEFKVYEYRIGSTIYDTSSPEFEEAFNKEMMWMKLSND